MEISVLLCNFASSFVSMLVRYPPNFSDRTTLNSDLTVLQVHDWHLSVRTIICLSQTAAKWCACPIQYIRVVQKNHSKDMHVHNRNANQMCPSPRGLTNIWQTFLINYDEAHIFSQCCLGVSWWHPLLITAVHNQKLQWETLLSAVWWGLS